MPTSRPGRHELGQNFLTDRNVVRRIVHLAAARPGPLVEWGTGDGALTLPLAELGRPLVGIELDRSRARRLGRRVGPHVCIEHGDILRHAPPAGAVVVSNVPFHLTTPVLRHLLAEPLWHSAILITQWEVARKRAGVGGATQLTAQWWPWFDFSLDRRIPATSFRPVPSVDAGLLVIDRMAEPQLPLTVQRDYQEWVRRVFSSRGRGLPDILRRNGVPAPVAARVVGGRRSALPRNLDANGWVTAFTAARSGRHTG
ncbi:23S ribosomal RNA methyltransferase Erm [Calidifontibacter sp. DB0510]|uniref:23S ribosomal RNA methyltransferase Erm n=1 Tax=Metallococcus carri TaxID=1656884 RepID=A0A967B999_9MICO|nr:rRNA adenine N(6)-methyltransferase family protein [Metallococcus carri]NHN57191.1 23S ribosomal RNA methyltransferase Erm [Metallococcus carri]NOP38006.1 23S ribosomal RNA methyltransferase Erm [Calidifontibacter sp. DB2511S]